MSRTQFGLEATAAGHDPPRGGGKRSAGQASTTSGDARGRNDGGPRRPRTFAIAVVILGRWRVTWVVLAALAIGLTDALRLRLEDEVDIPVQLLGLLSWLVVLTMLIAGARVAVMPHALGREVDH